MKTLVIVAHPNLENSRVNKRWMEELRNNKDITINNLCEEYGDEKINIEREQQLLLKHDRIVFQYPFYWYNMPHILKKWQDEVLTYGWAFGPKGDKLKGKECVLAISVGGPEVSYQAGGYNNFTLSELLKPMQQTANLTGMKYLSCFKLYESVVVSEEKIEESAKDYVKYILDPELNPEVALARITKEMEEQGTEL